MTINARDELMKYIPIADAIAQTFGKNCEVVLYDLTTSQSSVIYTTNNHVTGIENGHPFNHLLTQVLLSKNLQNDVAANYQIASNGKENVKSTSVLLRNTGGDAIGCLTINYDTEPLFQIQQFLSDIVVKENPPDLKKETEYNNVQEIAKTFIQQIIGESDVEKMDRRKKLEIVASMEEKGVFLIRGALETVADALQVSKVTIYSYLDEIRDRAEGN